MEEMTEEEFQAIKARWSAGPELYQSDADAMIGEIARLTNRVRALELEVEGLRCDHGRDCELASCPICGGTGAPGVDGVPCACGGSGEIVDSFEYVHREWAQLRAGVLLRKDK